MADAVVIIPTYNERENIGKIVRRVMALPEALDLLVVDDGSPDGTGGDVRALQLEFPGRLFLEERIGQRGLGGAYISAGAIRRAIIHDEQVHRLGQRQHAPHDFPDVFPLVVRRDDDDRISHGR